MLVWYPEKLFNFCNHLSVNSYAWLIKIISLSDNNKDISIFIDIFCAKSLQSCPILCDPMDCSPPGSSVLGILQARILEGIAMPSSRGSSQPRDRTYISLCLLHWQESSLPLELLWKLKKESVNHSVVSNSATPMDYSLEGSSVHGILQARILEWVARPSSRGSSKPRGQTWVSCIVGRFFTI